MSTRYPALFKSSWNPNAKGDEAMSSGVSKFETDWLPGLYEEYNTTLNDGVPLIIHARHGHPAAICVCEKAGSTRWKRLFHKEMSGEMLEAGIHSYNASWLPQNFLQWEQEIMQPSRMRFMIGFKYHFYLKSEEIDVWYPGFVSYVGLESSVKSGWGYTDATPDCFHPLGGMTCKQTDLAIRHRRASPAGAKDEDQLPSFTMHAVDKHSTGADKLLEMFYTKEVAERVYQLYKADFKEFGYEKMESSA
eukprot:CAMPEP_0117686414 /NCGR_PEP_ID=MMETSP0804-20121206/22432_1 /TAXON_ID=1074897 /ORGANISM="Tetraselmis astigmatica, Strain CCMP880" /LENGTH=247 /DNA_ID=CAMNT_0005498095 /DNA_START=242 /DNA_END=985 /DNA_ORIENTATION=+